MIEKLFKYYRTIRHLKFIQIWNRIVRKVIPFTVPQADLDASFTLRSKWLFCNSPEIFDGENFTFLNKTIALKSADDWNLCTDDKLWLYNLHYFDFLKQCEFRKNPCSDTLIERWIDENPVGIGNGWEPYTLSLRIVNWIKWIWNNNKPSEKILNNLYLQCRALSRQLEYHLLANHLMSNGKALIFAGLFFQGKEAECWLKKGWQIYQKEINEQVLEDGGHFERSPMYHSIILEDLLDVYQASGKTDLKKTIEKMLFFLECMTHPDRQIALFNDAAWKIAPSPDDIFNYASALGFRQFHIPDSGVVDLAQSGYVRVKHGKWDLFLDCGDIGPAYQPGHAHADTLSFELTYCGRRILSDSGTGSYQGKERAYQRSTAAHNTIVIDGKNSSEVWSAHRVGARAKILTREKLISGYRSSHNGFKNVICTRTWLWDEKSIQIYDQLNGRGIHKIELFFHLMPDEKITLIENHKIYTSSDLIITLPENGTLDIEETHISPEFGIWFSRETIKLTVIETLPLELSTQIAIRETL